MTDFTIIANSIEMGTYSAETAAGALDAYAQDAGYENYEVVTSQFGGEGITVIAQGGKS